MHTAYDDGNMHTSQTTADCMHTVCCWHKRLLKQTKNEQTRSTSEGAAATSTQTQCCVPHLGVLLLLAPCLQR